MNFLKIKVSDEVFQQVTAFLGGDHVLARWWVDEYEKRAETELAEALEEQAIVSAMNFKAEHRPVNGLGQCMFRIGLKLDTWLHTYVPGYVYDQAFINKLIADNNHLCLRPTVAAKAMIINPGLPLPATHGA